MAAASAANRLQGDSTAQHDRQFARCVEMVCQPNNICQRALQLGLSPNNRLSVCSASAELHSACQKQHVYPSQTHSTQHTWCSYTHLVCQSQPVYAAHVGVCCCRRCVMAPQHHLREPANRLPAALLSVARAGAVVVAVAACGLEHKALETIRQGFGHTCWCASCRGCVVVCVLALEKMREGGSGREWRCLLVGLGTSMTVCSCQSLLVHACLGLLLFLFNTPLSWRPLKCATWCWAAALLLLLVEGASVQHKRGGRWTE